jgi:hypothetical protein
VSSIGLASRVIAVATNATTELWWRVRTEMESYVSPLRDGVAVGIEPPLRMGDGGTNGGVFCIGGRAAGR